MSRPQQFERDDVLNKALMVFWKKGFKSTSVQDLVDATGLNRGSLYNSFGDKAALFAAVMENYRSTAPSKPLMEAAQNPHSDADAHVLIVHFFNDLVTRALADQDRKGCLLTNTLAGVYGCDNAMAEWICTTLDGLEETFHTLIKRGQGCGSISSPAKPRAIARSLVASAQGLNIIARTGAKPQALKDIATQAMRVLDR